MSDHGAIDERVRELVAARRPILEQLIREAVDAEIAALVDAELERTLTNCNGATRTAKTVAPKTKVCRDCRRDLELAAYEPGRNLCRRCRREALARSREHRQAATATTAAGEEPPRPGDNSGGSQEQDQGPQFGP